MTTYASIRPFIKNGDVLGVKSRGAVAWSIRGLTGESLNHVAMLVRIEGGVWVAEMLEGTGYRLTPASQWMSERASDQVFWIQAPGMVRGKAKILDYVLQSRAKPPRYSYWTLISVWWSQLRNRRTRGLMVCSTWVERAWSFVGYPLFDRLADPGDFFEHGQAVIPIQRQGVPA